MFPGFCKLSLLFLATSHCSTRALAAPSELDRTRLVYEFPLGTWLENLAVRRDGSILVNLITSPDLYLVDPLLKSAPSPTLVHTFPEVTALLGITETREDTFFVVGSNFSLATLSAAPGSNRIYRVSLKPGGAAASVDLVSSVTDALLLNGLTTLDSDTILAADSGKGVVWAIDTHSGAAKVAISDPLMAPNSDLPLGINGIKTSGSTLYFTNSAQSILAKIPIHRNGSAAGSAVAVASSPTGFDDFALDQEANAYLATSTGNSVSKVDAATGKQIVLAGNLNSTEIAEPTAVAFGRTRLDSNTLYVTTGGGLARPVNGNLTVGGQLVAIYLRL